MAAKTKKATTPPPSTVHPPLNFSELQPKNFLAVYAKVTEILCDSSLSINTKKSTLENWLTTNFPFTAPQVKKLSSFFLQQVPTSPLFKITQENVNLDFDASVAPSSASPSYTPASFLSLGVHGPATTNDLLYVSQKAAQIQSWDLSQYPVNFQLNKTDTRKFTITNILKVFLSMIVISRIYPHKNG